MKHHLLRTLSFSLLSFSLATATTLSFASTSAPVVPPPVGSCYGGGIVFYLNKAPHAPVGQRGLVVALEDAGNSDYHYWSLSTTEVSTSVLFFTGESNTQNILNTLPKNDQSLTAAEAADAYNTTDTSPPFTRWYLPSRDELALLYLQANNYKNFWSNPNCMGNPLIQETYWSSTQHDPVTAWYVDFSDGRVIQYPTPGPARIRAVRAF